MYEFSVAAKYLTPRWRQLSVSIISLISILVIALVVWLIVVFFSVKDGLERSWIEKLIALTAPVRVTPTEAYYSSYYYLVDGISSESDYTSKSIGEKLTAENTDPYNSDTDEEPPAAWPEPDLDEEGKLKDLVKTAYKSISLGTGADVRAHEYLTTVATLNLSLARNFTSQTLSQASYLGSYEPSNPSLQKALLEPTAKDAANLLQLASINTDQEEEGAPLKKLDPIKTRERLRQLLAHLKIIELKTPAEGWIIPKHLLPKDGVFSVAAVRKGSRIISIVIPQDKGKVKALIEKFQKEGQAAIPAQLIIRGERTILQPDDAEPIDLPNLPVILLEPDLPLASELEENSINEVTDARGLKFHIGLTLQGKNITGVVRYANLGIHKALFQKESDNPIQSSLPWAYTIKKDGTRQIGLPSSHEIGDGILVPKSFRNAGILLGDRGTLSYYGHTASSVQEQSVPIFIAGFYDPGIMPVGGKFLLASSDLTNLIYSSQGQEGQNMSNGINVRFTRLEDADKVKNGIQNELKKNGIEKYWKVETYKEYEFTRDLIQQLLSEKNMFSLLATVIIVVACSNIISMLIILVNDKKLEIGILRSMGATSSSIAIIFGVCGVVMGVIGSLIGTAAAIFTLKHIQAIVDFIGKVQGYDMFNPLFYGETLPAELSFEALAFVIGATAVISLLSGLVPAIKASMMRPSAILRAE